MSRIICYLRTVKEIDVFLNALFSFGAIYIAHEYYEVSNKFIKSRDRFESKLKCKICGDVSISWWHN